MHAEATKLAPDYVVAFMPVVGAGIIVAGVAILKHPDAVARFFRRAAEPLYGQRVSAKVYTARGARVAGAGYVVFGVIMILVGVVVLIARHV